MGLSGLRRACRRTRRLTMILLLMLISQIVWCQTVEEIALGKPMAYPDTPENRRRAEAMVSGAALLVNRKYAGFIRAAAETASARSAYLLEVKTVYQEEGTVLALLLRRRGDGREAELSLIGGAGAENAGQLAAAIFSVWGSFHDYLADRLQPPPLYVDELPTAALGTTLLPGMRGMPGMLTPMSAAVRQNGNLLVGFSLLCAELSSDFRVIGQPGRILYDEGNFTYAGQVAVTPGGTLFFKPSLGRELYRLPEGLPRPETWRVGIDLFGPFAALPDGSAVVIDLQNRQAWRIEAGRRRQIDLFSGPNSYISAVAVGPEGNIWVYDSTQRNIRIHSPRGEHIDTVMPLMNTSRAVTGMSVYRDGRFVLYLTGAAARLSCFTRSGIPVWHLDALPGPAAAIRRSLLLTFGLVGALGIAGAMLQTLVVVRPLRKLREDVAHRWDMETDIDPTNYPEEVAPLVEDINTLLERNREIVARGRRQAADMAHALKTPSAILRNELETLNRDEVDV